MSVDVELQAHGRCFHCGFPVNLSGSCSCAAAIEARHIQNQVLADQAEIIKADADAVASKFVPMNGDCFTPDYYRLTLRDLQGTEFTTDVTEIARQLPYIAGNIIKYAVRAGKKNNAKHDVTKIIEYARRWLQEL